VGGDAPIDVRVFESPLFDACNKQKTTFVVGQLVDVSRRTEVGMCQPGGLARITLVAVGRNGIEHYDVSYVLSGTKEKQIPVSILKEHIDYAGRPRRSLEAESTGNIDELVVAYVNSILTNKLQLTTAKFSSWNGD